jgi:hypothetical protein
MAVDIPKSSVVSEYLQFSTQIDFSRSFRCNYYAKNVRKLIYVFVTVILYRIVDQTGLQQVVVSC